MIKKLILIMMMCALLAPTVYAYREVWDIYHDKDVMIQMWKDLCNSHSSTCSYEVIGKSYLGKDIYLFKVGTPTGGKVLIDGSMHGWEDSGTEFSYVFAKYILEGSDSEARRIQKNNYMLFIPIINMDSAYRQTMKRVLDDGTKVPYGVDVNRNFCTRFEDAVSKDPTNNYEYRGPYCASETETQAVRGVMQKYRPKVYLNVHMGASRTYGTCNANSVIGKKIIAEYDAIRKANNITYRYRIGGACGAGMAPSDAYAFGADAWFTETLETAYIPDTVEGLIKEYWPLNYPMWVAMAHAVEVVPTTTTTNTAPTQGTPYVRASDHPNNTTSATLTCHNTTTYDAEGDKIIYYYRWFKNNVQVTGQYGYSVAPSYTNAGDVWKCEMRPYDSKLYGTAKNSSTITIRATPVTNTAPTQGNPTLKISDSPKNSTEGTLTCHNTTTYDAEGDKIIYYYRWFKNNVQVTGQYGYSVAPSYTNAGDVWKCEMRPYDGKLYGTAKNSSTITIRATTTTTNTAPTQGTPYVRASDHPNNTTNASLTCYNTTTYDAEKDTITNIYKWYKNNIVVSGLTTRTISSSNTATGDVWKCEMRPYDGKLYGTAKNSSTITIRTLCGNNVCESGESCSSCSSDCGICDSGISACTLTGKTWNEDSSLNNAYNLNDCFYDPLNHRLTYRVSGNSSIRIRISNGIVNLSAPTDWSGSESITFTAYDTTNYSRRKSTNAVTLTVNSMPDCGDNTCEAGEDCTSCPTDCGSCPVEEPEVEVKKSGGGGGSSRSKSNDEVFLYCGDNICTEDSEDCTSCSADCGECPIIESPTIIEQEIVSQDVAVNDQLVKQTNELTAFAIVDEVVEYEKSIHSHIIAIITILSVIAAFVFLHRGAII